MAESAGPSVSRTSGGGRSSGDTAAAGAAPAGIPFYEKQRQDLKMLLAKKRALEKELAHHEELILQKEADYLDNTPYGNIITGFESYTKVTSGSAAAAARRNNKLGSALDSNRVFSRSSISYNPNARDNGGTSTPGGGGVDSSRMATPLSAGFGGAEVGSKAISNGATKQKHAKKHVGAGDDSETDGREPKKVRVAFGAVRK